MFDRYLNNMFVWCILAYIIGLVINKTVIKKRHDVEMDDRAYYNKIVASINKMNGSQFEDFVGYIFKDLGIKAKATPKTRDGGKDFILKTKDGTVYVEVKRYSSKNLISSPTVLKLLGSAVSDGVAKCLFITTSRFTKDAINLAENSKIPIELIDIDGFLDMCKKCNKGGVLNYLGY